MKKLIFIFSIFLFVSFTIKPITVIAQQSSYSQGFYTMKDLNLYENIPYSIQNLSQKNSGLLIIIDSNKKIQKIIRIAPGASNIPLRQLKSNYNFIIYGDVKLTFS